MLEEQSDQKPRGGERGSVSGIRCRVAKQRRSGATRASATKAIRRMTALTTRASASSNASRSGNRSSETETIGNNIARAQPSANETRIDRRGAVSSADAAIASQKRLRKSSMTSQPSSGGIPQPGRRLQGVASARKRRRFASANSVADWRQRAGGERGSKGVA